MRSCCYVLLTPESQNSGAIQKDLCWATETIEEVLDVLVFMTATLIPFSKISPHYWGSVWTYTRGLGHICVYISETNLQIGNTHSLCCMENHAIFLVVESEGSAPLIPKHTIEHDPELISFSIPQLVSLRFFLMLSYLVFSLPNNSFPNSFTTKIMYIFLVSP
jgi:hypothetical protein